MPGATIKCPYCEDDPAARGGCPMCRGRGMVFDTGAADGTPDYARQAPPMSILSRLPAFMAAAGDVVAIAANDGTMWLGSFGEDGWAWKRLPDLPQGKHDVDA